MSMGVSCILTELATRLKLPQGPNSVLIQYEACEVTVQPANCTPWAGGPLPCFIPPHPPPPGTFRSANKTVFNSVGEC